MTAKRKIVGTWIDAGAKQAELAKKDLLLPLTISSSRSGGRGGGPGGGGKVVVE